MSAETTTEEGLARRADDLLAELDDVDGRTLNAAEIKALIALSARARYLLGIAQDQNGMETTAMPEETSRTATQKIVRRILAGRPWRGKVERRRDGHWTIVAKSYTDVGVVVVYAGSTEDLMTIVDVIEEPFRQNGRSGSSITSTIVIRSSVVPA